MSRSNVTFSGAAGAPASTAPATGRLFITGRSQTGEAGQAVKVTGMADFRAVFGARAGFTALNDELRCFFQSGGAEAYVVRALGATPVKATISLDSGKLVITAAQYGAYANGWTAAYTASSKTLTVTNGVWTETWTGTDAAALVADAAASQRVTVTSSGTLPSGDVAATPLATGADDYAAADFADLLGLFPAELGPGAVAVAGEPYTVAGQALASHAAHSRREALTALAAGASAAAALAAVAAVAAYDEGADKTIVAWPHVTFSDSGATITAGPVGYFAGIRARAHQEVGSWRSPLRSMSINRFITGTDVIPTDAQIDQLVAGSVSFARPIDGLVQIDGWYTAAPSLGIDTLRGAQFAAVLDAIGYGAQKLADKYVGNLVDRVTIGNFEGDLKGLLAPFVTGRALFPGYGTDGVQTDPGYVINVSSDVNTTSTMAAGQINADIQLRLTASAETVNINISAGDASITF